MGLGEMGLGEMGQNRQSRDLKLFGREIIFEEFQRMWSRYLNVTDGRTDRQTYDMQSHHRALR